MSKVFTGSQNAVGFVRAFRKSGLINLVAIDPITEKLTGITRPISDAEIFEFINNHNGKSNLYFMPNTPKLNAPDNKLKKEHVEFINAVWLDLDPNRNKAFDQERERLFRIVQQLQASENPPTYIIDSGGGYQAFWVLKNPVLATPDAIRLYEAYSRSLAEQYGADKVQNIDRIMRIPCTWNLPTAKKIKQGRTKALAKIVYATSREGVRYE